MLRCFRISRRVPAVQEEFIDEGDNYIDAVPAVEPHEHTLTEHQKRRRRKADEKRFLDIMIPKPDYVDRIEREEEKEAEEEDDGNGRGGGRSGVGEVDDDGDDDDGGRPSPKDGMSPRPKRVVVPPLLLSQAPLLPPPPPLPAATDDIAALIVPRKLTNPCAESKEKKELHRELLFNQKIGRNVIGQKSELKKAMDKFQDEQKKKELEMEKHDKRTSLERRLEEQANKIDKMERVLQESSEPTATEMQSEFHRVHAKVRARVDAQ